MVFEGKHTVPAEFVDIEMLLEDICFGSYYKIMNKLAWIKYIVYERK